MLNKVEYIDFVAISFSKFAQAGSCAQTMNAFNSMLEALQKLE